MRNFFAPFLATAGLLAGTPQAACADPWDFVGTAYTDIRSAGSDDEDGTNRGLEPSYGGGISASRTFDLDEDRVLGLSFGTSTERFYDAPESNRLLFDADPYLAIKLDQGMLRELRFFGAATHALDDHGWVFSRGRAGSALRLQLAPRTTLQLRVRGGYREQNDADTFRGYDQSELLLDGTYNWRSEDSANHITAIPYYERRDAEASKYSYDEFGIRFIGRHNLDEKLSLVLRANTFARDYDKGLREDDRLRVTLGSDWDVRENTTIGAFAGYERNWSTRADADYGGPVVGIALTQGF